MYLLSIHSVLVAALNAGDVAISEAAKSLCRGASRVVGEQSVNE